MKNSVIYGIFFPNGKIYIGQTNNFNNRMHAHEKMYKGCHNSYLSHAIKKYGWENIQKEILLECDIEYVDFFERAFISGYNSTNQLFGYNLDSGGSKSKVMSEVSKHKMSIARKGKTYEEIYGKENSIRIKAIQHDLKVGQNSCRYGKPSTFKGKKHTIETREKMSKSRVGIKYSDETLKKMSDAKLGKKLSNAHKEKISKSLMGR